MAEREIKPWYREPWPWIIMGSIGTVVVGVFVTLGFAISSDDGLVAKDYYARGININKTLALEQRSEALGLGAVLTVLPDDAVQVVLQSKSRKTKFVPPPIVELHFMHPRFAEMDKEVTLTLEKDGTYSGRVAMPTEGKWEVYLEGQDWRLPILGVEAPITIIRWKSLDVPVTEV